MNYELRFISSLEKVFPKGGLLPAEKITDITGFLGQRVSFQAAYCFHGEYYVDQTLIQATRVPYVSVETETDFEGDIQIRKVECVPVNFPCYQDHDFAYLDDKAGLYPDLLVPTGKGLHVGIEQWRALWIDCFIPKNMEGGERKIELIFTLEDGKKVAGAALTLHIVPVALPTQKLIHTEWFYADCLADYYQCEVFSEKHWGLIEAFMKTAVSNGINMIFTPLFTPALDTLIGGERTTTQLIQIKKKEGEYCFDFSLLHQWLNLAKKVGYEYFEMSHLFSQWGAKYPPKVVVNTGDKEEKLFGWHTPVGQSDYSAFLESFLPKLVEELKKSGVDKKTFFHISDEPTTYNADTYQKAYDMVIPYIQGFPIIDALSHLELYQKGIVKKPVPSNDHIHAFLEAGLKDGWTYYCCGQPNSVSNRFMAMPLWRTRIVGAQLYKYQMEGFLHWGYNFYNSQYSVHRIDPFRVNDAEDAFPAGDAFLVYPGEGGRPLESIRLLAMADAMADIQAYQLLESLTNRDFVENIIEEGKCRLRFDDFPTEPDYLRKVWEKVVEEIRKRLASK